MASIMPNNQENPSFQDSLTRKPLESHLDRKRRGSKRKVYETLYPVNDSMDNEDICATEKAAEDHDVDNQQIMDSFEMNADLHLNAPRRSRSRSREKDFSASSPPYKNEELRLRKAVRHDKESRKSPDHEDDPPKLSPFDKNKVIPSRKNFIHDKPSNPNLSSVKASPVLRYSVLKYTQKITIISTTKESHIMKIVLVIALILAGYAIKQTLSSDSLEKKVTFDYSSIVSSFQPSFKGQPDFSYKVFRSALNSINKTDPSAPAVILFLASEGAEKLALSLGEKLVHSVSPSPIKISGKYYEKLDSDSGKKDIDDALRSMDTSSYPEYGAVLVEDLHRIPGETALMFHTYCDNENAPYKHAVYVLIVHMEEPIPVGSKMKDWDMAAYKRLNRAWRDIDEDQRGPLLSRLTVSVAAIV